MCVICGVKPTQIESTEFCGRECFLRSKRITKSCCICTQNFTVLRCFANQKTCGDKACITALVPTSRKDLNKSLKISCIQCGKDFEIRKKRSSVGIKKFCSGECTHAFQRENEIPLNSNSHGGDYVFNKAGKQHYNSLREFKRMKELDVDSNIESWARSSYRIPLLDANGKTRTYFPDFDIIYDDGTKIVEEMNDRIDDNALRKMSAGEEFFKNSEVQYRTLLSDKELASVEPAFETYDNDYGVFYRPTLAYVFMQLASSLASRSTCLRNSVGVVITDPQMTQAYCLGYNGGACGDQNQCASLEAGKCECIHAEINAISKADTSLRGCTAFVTISPCAVCSKVLINCGIARVIYLNPYRSDRGSAILREHGVEVTSYADFCLFEDE